MSKRRPIAQRDCITTRAPLEQKTVKSAGRVLEILEYFDDVRREATVMEIADALSYPQSSTSALLRSLVSLGYLSYNPRSRTYVTSSRVALLGNWVDSRLLAEGAIIGMMRELNEATGDTVVLAVRNGLHIKYIHVVQATNPARLHLTLGTVRPLAASGAGYALLSTMTDNEVSRLVMRINADAEEGQKLVRIRELLDELAQIRKRGYAFTLDMVTTGGGIIAAALPPVAGQPQQMVVGLGGISQVMRGREQELSAALLSHVGRCFGKQQTRDIFPGLSPDRPVDHMAMQRALQVA